MLLVSNLSLKRALKLSQYPFSHGEPGTISVVFDLTALIHAWIALATNSGPLSDRMKAGTPRMMNKSVSTSTTSVELSLRLTRVARHSRPSSSRMFNVLETFPSSVEVVRPGMVAIFRPQSHARPVIQPELSFLRLLHRHFQPLTPP